MPRPSKATPDYNFSSTKATFSKFCRYRRYQNAVVFRLIKTETYFVCPFCRAGCLLRIIFAHWHLASFWCFHEHYSGLSCTTKVGLLIQYIHTGCSRFIVYKISRKPFEFSATYLIIHSIHCLAILFPYFSRYAKKVLQKALRATQVRG